MSIRVAINGFGRIGRQVVRLGFQSGAALGAPPQADIEFVAINDLTSIETNAHLLKYDSVHGIFDGDIKVKDQSLIISGKKIQVLKFQNVSDLPWKDLKIDVVLECTGRFTERQLAEGHLKSGAKKVIVSAPCKNDDLTVVMGVNESHYDPIQHHVLSNASCTTNCLGVITKVLWDHFGIEKAVMTTIHSYTNDQRLLDLTHSDLRRARAAGQSMIPTSTGATEALMRIYPQLQGLFEGFSIRVPTPNVSLVDLVAVVKKKVKVQEVNGAFQKEASLSLKKYLRYCDEPLVSIDFLGDKHSAIVDAMSTQVIGGNLVKVMAWYDNEVGFSARMLDLVEYLYAH